MDINEMTRKQFNELPSREWDEEIICDSIIILPLRSMHESGYRCMDFVAVKDGEPICLISGGSDVLHIDGIGGYGNKWGDGVPKSVFPAGWNIDCLAKSGLLRLWCKGRILCGAALSSFEIYRTEEDKWK